MKSLQLFITFFVYNIPVLTFPPQFQCMAALTRQASVVSGIFSNKAIQRHCLRLLSGKERVGKIDDF